MKAVDCNPAIPDTHFALGTIYRARWKMKEADKEMSIYKKLKEVPGP